MSMHSDLVRVDPGCVRVHSDYRTVNLDYVRVKSDCVRVNSDCVRVNPEYVRVNSDYMRASLECVRVNDRYSESVSVNPNTLRLYFLNILDNWHLMVYHLSI